MASTTRIEGEAMMYMACRVGQTATKVCPLSKADGALYPELLPS